MKVEFKRDKNGRFVGKTAYKIEKEVTSEPLEGISVEDHIKQLEKERDTYKLTAEKLMGKHLSAMDALREAYMLIGWLQSKLPWWTKMIHYKKILSLNNDLDNMVAKAEGLDKE